MKLPFKRQKPDYTYEMERERLLNWLNDNEPDTEEYEKVMHRLNELDKLINRTSELKKTVIPALGTLGGVTAIYAVQQFAGVLLPKIIELNAARQEQKKTKELD